MKYSYNWLKELSGTKLSASEVAQKFLEHSFEVEGVENPAESLEKVVVGEVLEASKHPDADKLRVTKVNVGDKVLDIVCGAHNFEAGDKVPVALVGAILPGGFEIKKAKIRGEISEGMICAEDEIGLGDDHKGIMVLDDGFEVGTPLAEALQLEDSIIDIDILPNRGHDCLGYVGVARDICAIEKTKLNYPFNDLKLAEKKTDEIKIEIEDERVCPRYIGAVIEGVEIKESPDWMKQRLMASGINPINNIVDITNYVLLEIGQPMHAFDYTKISGGKIIVRNAKKDEKLEMLDESEKELELADLVIADSEKPLVIAGVMGGMDSGISGKTTKIILESANFDGTSVRRTRTRHALQTDSSTRFEKGLDPSLAEKAMVRALELVKELVGGEFKGVVDNYPNPLMPWHIKLDLKYVNSLLGVVVPANEVEKILISLDLKLIEKKDDELVFEVPTFRLDLITQEDLIEEVGRIYGYDKIPVQAPMEPVKSPVSNERRVFARDIKNELRAAGFSEIYTYPFYSREDAENAMLLGFDHLEPLSAVSQDLQLLRISMIPNLLNKIRLNLKNFEEFKIFEIGNIFIPVKDVLPAEQKMIVGAIVGAGKEDEVKGFFEAKGHLDNLFDSFGISNVYYDQLNPEKDETYPSLWHLGRSASIKVKEQDEQIGFVGEINPVVLNNFGIKKRVVVFKLVFEKLVKFINPEIVFYPIHKYPTVIRDISMLADKNVLVGDIDRTIGNAGGKLVQDVDLFDIYEMQESEKTSYAFRITFGDPSRTLESKEVDDLMKNIMETLEDQLDIEIRK